MNDSRAMSSVLGIVLILGITIAAVTSMMVIGTYALQQSQSDAQLSQMETSMAEFSSKASLPALGEASAQRFNLGSFTDGSVTVEPEAGTVHIIAENETGVETFNETRSLGALVYEQDEGVVAYQGGGVWSLDPNGHSEMVSPPEYHFSSETLTFPIINVEGNGTSNARASGTVSQDRFERIYPNQTEELGNPLDDQNVTVIVESEYHWGWASFFEERTEGDITHKESEQKVTMELTVPFREGFADSLATRGAAELHRNSDVESVTEGANYPSVTPEVEERFTECDNEEGTSFDGTDTNASEDNELFCADGDVTIEDDLTFETNGHDMEVVVPGDLMVEGGQNISISGNGDVRFYNGGTIEPGNGEWNTDGPARALIFYVHSEVDEIDTGNNNFDMNAVIYAPGTSIEFDGTIEFNGAIVADEFSSNSASIEVSFDESLEDESELGFDPRRDVIRYLHVTENTVEVELD